MAPVSFYEVSSRLTSFMRAIPLVMISVLIPATSELDARKDPEKIIRTYRMASRYVAMVTVPLVASWSWRRDPCWRCSWGPVSMIP